MRYWVMTHVSPEDVVERAKGFFAEHASVQVSRESRDAVTFTGEIGTAQLRVDRAHGRTNVRVRTDRGAGLDITDLTKQFLYTLGHV